MSRRGFVAGAVFSGALGAASPAFAAAKTTPKGRNPRLPSVKTIKESDPCDVALLGVAALLQAGELSSVELTTALLDRAAARDGATTAWRRVYPEFAMALATAADQQLVAARRKGGKATSLVCGVPLALKDLYAVQGFELTASSNVLAGNIASGDCTVWSKLKAAGMVLIGHAETDEFAIGVGTPQVGNPWNPDDSPGGSSGGSGALLGARLIPAATGTDTGGSLRLPATACGITSIKPSFSRASAYGVIPLEWSRDHCGAMGRAAGDASLLLSYMAGPDYNDPTTLSAPLIRETDYPTMPTGGTTPFRGLRFGVITADVTGIPAATAALFSRFLTDVQNLGGTLVDVALPDYPSDASTTYELAEVAECGVYHQQFVPGSTGKYRAENQADIAAAISAANSVTVADYLGYEQQKLLFMHQYNALFADNRLDAILVPGSSIDGAKREEVAGLTFLSGSVPGDVAWANLAGAPALCTPVGLSAATGMPFGVQIGGLPWQETKVLQIAIDYQHHHPYWAQAPKPLMVARTLNAQTQVAVPATNKVDPTNTIATRPALGMIPTLATGPVAESA
jgi:aspartyl-tRNA(Asn)/glutamyl-tRNA(Gln) amidotransferase subunit A